MPHGRPSLAVLMPVYNAAEFLPAAIESILAQTWHDFRFVIVDDGSTDESPAILRAYAGRDARITVLSQPNAGAAAALNLGLRTISADYVARMDADDVALPERFARQLARMESDPHLAVLGTRVHCIDRGGRLRRVRPVASGAEALAAALPYRNAINHPSTMLRTTTLVAVGGYREKFRLSQDYDLWLRLMENHRLDNLDETLLHYRTYEGRASSAANRARQTAYSVAAAADFFSRRHGLPIPDAAIDVAEPAAVTDALRALLRLDLAPWERRALHRHSLRLVRNVPGRTTQSFAAFVRRRLWDRREYGQLLKLGIYSASKVFRSG